MCVIIKREPKILIPEDKIISACHVNPDGYGFSIVDRDRLETIKIHNAKGNDSTEILKRLEDAKDHLVYLHLRYTTAGKTNEENCHPFEVFKGDNFEVQFMHNGTLSKFAKGVTDNHSDTWHFNEEILKPMIRAFYEVDGAGVLLNPVVAKILAEFKGASAFMLYDNEGNTLAVENSACKQFDGWWASNEYSFNRSHREPVKTSCDTGSTRYESYYYGGYADYDHYDTYDYNTRSKTTSATTAVKETKPVATVLEKTTRDECKKVGYAIMQAKKQGILPRTLTPPSQRLTFLEMAELSDLKDIMTMTEGDIYDLVEELPLAATALVMDLIHALYEKDQAAKRTTAASVTPIKSVA